MININADLNSTDPTHLMITSLVLLLVKQIIQTCPLKTNKHTKITSLLAKSVTNLTSITPQLNK